MVVLFCHGQRKLSSRAEINFDDSKTLLLGHLEGPWKGSGASGERVRVWNGASRFGSRVTDRGAETEQPSGDKLWRLENPPPGTPGRPLERFRGVRGARQSLKRGFAVVRSGGHQSTTNLTDILKLFECVMFLTTKYRFSAEELLFLQVLKLIITFYTSRF